MRTAPKEMVCEYRGIVIWKVQNYFVALGASHGTIWSAKCYIDEFMQP